MEPPKILLGVLEAAERYLAGRGVDAPRLSAQLLLAKVLGVDRIQLYLQHDRPLGEAERGRYRELVARRARHEPLAYLLGSWSFRGLELAVDPSVLIPRPETEGLVDLALAHAPQGARCVDLGTGSGAIALALARERPDLRVTAIELSTRALALARRNAERLGLTSVRFLQGSWWQALGVDERFELVVANPPYVDPARPDLIADDVRRYEPAEALFTPPGDPGAPYRAIAAGLARHLVPGGWCILETGVVTDQAALAALRATPVLTDVEMRCDAAGLPRYLLGRRSAPA
ncbi:MAG: peptide chain release factor N(5)-glutamine methyltransferase [Planctomycetes bacterium]|nr:peptide chain release factor N(5)-glutamine methyltransferase [Planctomycetota bacterium]